MSADTIITAVGGVVAALVTVGVPVLVSARRAGAQAASEGALTREAVTNEIRVAMARIEGRLDRVESWTVAHTAEHIAETSARNQGDT